jgi:hypothetical protein
MARQEDTQPPILPVCVAVVVEADIEAIRTVTTVESPGG